MQHELEFINIFIYSTSVCTVRLNVNSYILSLFIINAGKGTAAIFAEDKNFMTTFLLLFNLFVELTTSLGALLKHAASL